MISVHAKKSDHENTSGPPAKRHSIYRELHDRKYLYRKESVTLKLIGNSDAKFSKIAIIRIGVTG